MSLRDIEPPIPAVVPEFADGKTDVPMAPALLAYAELRFHGTGQADEAAELLLPFIDGRDDATTLIRASSTPSRLSSMESSMQTAIASVARRCRNCS